jgi:hypothetical protein
MPDSFETPYDGHHHFSDPGGTDWRRSPFERLVSYGNFAGPGNRNDAAHNPSGGPATPYKPIDGMDAAASRHDEGYEALDGHSMWSWDGIRRVSGADRRLAEETDQEMARNGSKYSSSAQNYSKAMRGIFGGRATVVEGANWAGNKAHEAEQGISDFAHSAQNWHSMGDAARGIGSGLHNGASWLGNTAAQGLSGVRNAASYFGHLGPLGVLGAAVGGGEALGAGAVHAAGQAWDGAKHAGSEIASGASSLAHSAGSAISNGASAVAGGARAAGSAVGSAASKAWHWLAG